MPIFQNEAGEVVAEEDGGPVVDCENCPCDEIDPPPTSCDLADFATRYPKLRVTTSGWVDIAPCTEIQGVFNREIVRTIQVAQLSGGYVLDLFSATATELTYRYLWATPNDYGDAGILVESVTDSENPCATPPSPSIETYAYGIEVRVRNSTFDENCFFAGQFLIHTFDRDADTCEFEVQQLLTNTPSNLGQCFGGIRSCQTTYQESVFCEVEGSTAYSITTFYELLTA